MARTSPVVLILGHSFVRRLCHDLEISSDQRADVNFNLEVTAVVFMHGVGGRTVPRLRMFDLHVVKRLSPDIIILKIGTNDLMWSFHLYVKECFKLFTSIVPRHLFLCCLQIMPPKRKKSSVSAPARKCTRRVKSSEGSALVVEQPQPQELSAEVLPHALPEEIINKVSDEVTRRLSSKSGKRTASEILDRNSDVLVTGDAAGDGADQVSEVPAIGIPVDSPGKSVIEGAVSQFQDRLSGELPIGSPTLPNTLLILPIDARVSANLRAKILKNDEFIDFWALATNPVLESKFQLVLQSEGGTQPPSLALEPVT